MPVSSKYTKDLSVQIVFFTFSCKWLLCFYFWAVIWSYIVDLFAALLELASASARTLLKAETHDATNRGDKSPRLHCCCDKSLALSLSLRYVAQIQTSLNLCDRSQRQNSVAATMIFTCHTRRLVAATCRGDVSQRFVAPCVSTLRCLHRVLTARAQMMQALVMCGC